MIKKLAGLLLLMSMVMLSACGRPHIEVPEGVDQVAELSTAIQALGPGVDPEEADRAARIAYEYTAQLAQEYQITDSALVHNSKVNLGLKPRGLCYHWANDIMARLEQENFTTLQMHGAIANANNPFRLEHSTAVISRRGDTHFEGIVLDSWRNAGVLHWAPTLEDTKYNWRPREEVFEMKRRIQAEREARKNGG